MNPITAELSVGELVAEQLGRSRVFEKFGIDYCCNGGTRLTEACISMNISIEDVLAELDEADSVTRETEDINFDTMDLDLLIEHILSTHHAYLAEELPRLTGLAEKVADAHFANDSRVRELESVVRALEEELTSHMGKEERILFPCIRKMAQTGTLPVMPFGTLANPIYAMESEHDSAGGALQRIRSLTDEYAEPEWACNTYRALLDGLRSLELDLHQHIHKENNILFPKALAMEREMAQLQSWSGK